MCPIDVCLVGVKGKVGRGGVNRSAPGLDGTHDLVDTVPGYTGGLEPDVR